MIPVPIALFFAKFGLRIIIALVVVAAVIFAVRAYNEGLREDGRDEVRAEWAIAVEKQAAAEREQTGKASINLESDRVKTRTVYRTITKSVDKYIDRPIYRNVCFDDDGLRDANAALRKSARADTGKPDAGVPAPDGTRQRAGRDSAPQTD